MTSLIYDPSRIASLCEPSRLITTFMTWRGACVGCFFLVVFGTIGITTELILSFALLYVHIVHGELQSTESCGTVRPKAGKPKGRAAHQMSEEKGGNKPLSRKKWENSVLVRGEGARKCEERDGNSNNATSSEETGSLGDLAAIARGQRQDMTIENSSIGDVTSKNVFRPRQMQRSPELRLRSIINKCTPEKFETLSIQLLEALSDNSEQFSLVLNLIFDAATKQHQYTAMYTDLCCKLKEHFAEVTPSVDFSGAIWEKCEAFFANSIVSPPELPDCAEEDSAAYILKQKNIMLGGVQFSASLVARGLVPSVGIYRWMEFLLGDNVELRLEAVCTMLTTLGPSMQLDAVFSKLHGMEGLSSRMQCLIRDVSDLRAANWHESRAHKNVKPTTLEVRPQSPQIPAACPVYATETEANATVDLCLVAKCATFCHHVEIMDCLGMKLNRLRSLIQLYAIMHSKKVLVFAGEAVFPRLAELFVASFPDLHCKTLYTDTDATSRAETVARFYSTGEDSIDVLVVSNDITVLDAQDTVALLVHFDMGPRFRVFVARLVAFCSQASAVYTFFYPHYDQRRAQQLGTLLEHTQQKVPQLCV